MHYIELREMDEDKIPVFLKEVVQPPVICCCLRMKHISAIESWGKKIKVIDWLRLWVGARGKVRDSSNWEDPAKAIVATKKKSRHLNREKIHTVLLYKFVLTFCLH